MPPGNPLGYIFPGFRGGNMPVDTSEGDWDEMARRQKQGALRNALGGEENQFGTRPDEFVNLRSAPDFGQGEPLTPRSPMAQGSPLLDQLANPVTKSRMGELSHQIASQGGTPWGNPWLNLYSREGQQAFRDYGERVSDVYKGLLGSAAAEQREAGETAREQMRGQTQREIADIGYKKQDAADKRAAQRDVASARNQLRKELSSRDGSNFNSLSPESQNNLVNEQLREMFSEMPEHLDLIPGRGSKPEKTGAKAGPDMIPEEGPPKKRGYSKESLGQGILDAAVKERKLNPEALRSALSGPAAVGQLTEDDLSQLADDILRTTGGGQTAAEALAKFLIPRAVGAGMKEIGGLPIEATRGGATGGYNIGGDRGMWLPGQAVRSWGGLGMPGGLFGYGPEQMTGTDVQGKILGHLLRRMYGR